MLAGCIDQELKSSALPSRDAEGGIEREGGRGAGCRTFSLAAPYQPLLQRRVGARRHLRIRLCLPLRLGGRRSPFPPGLHRVGSAAPRAGGSGEWMRGEEIWGAREERILNPPALDNWKFSNRRRSTFTGSGVEREVPPSCYGRATVRATGSS